MCVGDGNIKENIHVNCRKSVDFISVKNIQVVVVDSWKKWLNFVSSVYVMIVFIEKKNLQILSMMIKEMGMLSLSLEYLYGIMYLRCCLLVFEKWAKSAQQKVTMASVS